VTAADDHHTVTVRVGQTFTVELQGARRTFSALTVSGEKVLERIGNSRSGAAAEGYYRAIAPGNATLHALERPICSHVEACPMFILLWRAQVHVVR